jgi:ubiquinone/menaquinone biosynthesis C-methylase UbiE
MKTVPAEVGYRLWAATYDASDSAIVALEARHLAPRLAALGAARVIDIGCGTGRWMGIAADITGVDVSAAMLREAGQKPGMRGKLVRADARCLPFRDVSTDVVLSTLTIGHAAPVAKTLAELARIARPGGRVIVTDFHPEALRRGWSRTFRAGADVFEIESRPYSFDELHAGNLHREEFAELCFDEPERPIFERAGKPNLFEQVRGLPAIWMAIYRRTA